jgi:hypothetical protein
VRVGLERVEDAVCGCALPSEVDHQRPGLGRGVAVLPFVNVVGQVLVGAEGPRGAFAGGLPEGECGSKNGSSMTLFSTGAKAECLWCCFKRNRFVTAITAHCSC